MRPIYAGLLIGFSIASFILSSAGVGRYILPLSVLTVAAWVAVEKP